MHVFMQGLELKPNSIWKIYQDYTADFRAYSCTCTVYCRFQLTESILICNVQLQTPHPQMTHCNLHCSLQYFEHIFPDFPHHQIFCRQIQLLKPLTRKTFQAMSSLTVDDSTLLFLQKPYMQVTGFSQSSKIMHFNCITCNKVTFYMYKYIAQYLTL